MSVHGSNLNSSHQWITLNLFFLIDRQSPLHIHIPTTLHIYRHGWVAVLVNWSSRWVHTYIAGYFTFTMLVCSLGNQTSSCITNSRDGLALVFAPTWNMYLFVLYYLLCIYTYLGTYYTTYVYTKFLVCACARTSHVWLYVCMYACMYACMYVTVMLYTSLWLLFWL